MFEKSQFNPSCDASQCNEGSIGVGAFVVSGSDASELLEVSEGIFDSVAVSVNGLAEGPGDATVCFGRDNGSGPDLLHNILNDGVTVVSLVRQNGQRPRAVVESQQGFGLSAVVNMTASKDKVYGPSSSIGEQVNLGCQSAPRAPQSLIATTLSASGVLMRPHHGRVDHEHEEGSMSLAQSLQNEGPQSFTNPLPEPTVDGLPLPEAIRQGTPWRTVAAKPKHPREHQNVILARSTTLVLFCDMGFATPCVNFFRSANGGDRTSCCITHTA